MTPEFNPNSQENQPGDAALRPASGSARGAAPAWPTLSAAFLMFVNALLIAGMFAVKTPEVARLLTSRQGLGLPPWLVSGAFAGFASIFAPLLLVTATSFTIWLVDATRGARRLAPEDHDLHPTTSFGAFYLPFANIVLAPRAIRRLWRASTRHDPRGPRRHLPGELLWGVGWVYMMAICAPPLLLKSVLILEELQLEIPIWTVGVALFCASLGAGIFILSIHGAQMRSIRALAGYRFDSRRHP